MDPLLFTRKLRLSKASIIFERVILAAPGFADEFPNALQFVTTRCGVALRPRAWS